MPGKAKIRRIESDSLSDHLKELPEIDCTDFYIRCLQECGYIESDGMGNQKSISWQELQSWNDCSEMDLSGFELEVIKELSTSYANSAYLAKDQNCPPPYMGEIPKAEVAKKIKDTLRLAGKRK